MNIDTVNRAREIKAAHRCGWQTVANMLGVNVADLQAICEPPKGEARFPRPAPPAVVDHNRAWATAGSRGDIIAYLAEAEATSGQMVKALGYSNAAISTATHKLLNAGVIVRRRFSIGKRQFTMWSLSPAWLDGSWGHG